MNVVSGVAGQPGADPRLPVDVDRAGASAGPDNLLRHYAGVIRRRGKWIILGLVVGLLAGFVSTLFITKHHSTVTYYKATNTLVVNGGATSSSTGGSSGYTLQQAALLVQSQALIDRVAAKLRLSPSDVGSRLSATARGDVLALDITGISANNGQQAADLANTAGRYLNAAAQAQAQAQFIDQRNNLYAQLKDLQGQRDALQVKIATKPANADILEAQLTTILNQYTQVYTQTQTLGPASQNFALSVLQPAAPIQINGRGYAYRLNQNINSRGQAAGAAQTTAPDFSETDFGTQATIGKSTRIALGGAAGLVLGTTTAFLVEAWDDRIRRRDRVEELTGLPVLAEIPKLNREQIRTHAVPVADAPTGRAAERYRAARTSILFALQAFDTTAQPHGFDDITTGLAAAEAAERAPVIMVTSPSPAEGKSTSVASLAAAFADNGLRTLVVDGDFRRPAVARYLSPVPNLVDPERPATTRIDGVSFIAAPRNVDTPADAVYRLRRSIAQWQDQFDVVLLDTPPMLTTNDATDLLAAADAVVLVLRAGQTRTGPAERVANVLTRFRADVLGIVLNGCDNADMDPYYAYGYGYGYTGKKGKGGPGSGVFSPSPRHDPEYVTPTNGNGNGNGTSVFDGDGGAPATSSTTPPD
jgi:Mrp family chromosome partitioning ATPase/capsular polysaccharide biosynthesis protein